MGKVRTSQYFIRRSFGEKYLGYVNVLQTGYFPFFLFSSKKMREVWKENEVAKPG